MARYEREHITMEGHNHIVDTISGLFLTALGSLPAIMGGQNFVCDARNRLADEALRLAVAAARKVAGWVNERALQLESAWQPKP
jgi:hypothetical protein